MNEKYSYHPTGMNTHKTSNIVDTGYNENDFGENYWIGKIGDTPRVDRSPDIIIKYFIDLFKKLGIDKPGKFIDICAGAGNVVNGFRNRGIDAHGCEFSSAGRKVAKDRFGITLDACDLRGPLKYKTDEFEWGCCIAALSMIPKHLMANAIGEILRVVKYGVLIHVATSAGENKEGVLVNPHHLTGMTCDEYKKIINDHGAHDWTLKHPPQAPCYGIGVNGEFTGLFLKIENHGCD